MRKVKAMVHSKDNLAEVEILLELSNNKVYVLYENKVCTAIFNPFVELYYVDDKYGVLSDAQWKAIKAKYPEAIRK